MTGVELQNLIVRLSGDSTGYQLMIQEALAGTRRLQEGNTAMEGVSRRSAMAIRQLAGTVQGAGFAISAFNPEAGRLAIELGTVAQSASLAVSSASRLQAGAMALANLALNPLALVAIPAVVTGYMAWKKHSEEVAAAEKTLQTAIAESNRAIQQRIQYLSLFGMPPRIAPTEPQKALEQAGGEERKSAIALEASREAIAKLNRQMQAVREAARKQWQDYDRSHPITGEFDPNDPGQWGTLGVSQAERRAGMVLQLQRQRQAELEAQIAPLEAQRKKLAAEIKDLIAEHDAAESNLFTARGRTREAAWLQRQQESVKSWVQSLGGSLGGVTKREGRLGRTIGGWLGGEIEAAGKAAQQAQREQQAVLREGQAMMSSLFTPQEKYAAELANLDRLLEKNAVTEEFYARAVARAREELAGATVQQQEMNQALVQFDHVAFGSAEAARRIAEYQEKFGAGAHKPWEGPGSGGGTARAVGEAGFAAGQAVAAATQRTAEGIQTVIELLRKQLEHPPVELEVAAL